MSTAAREREREGEREGKKARKEASWRSRSTGDGEVQRLQRVT
jgi:hypothetical protein